VPFKRASGPQGDHRGIDSANVHPWIAQACNDNGVINLATYQALHTSVTLDGLMDLLEMQQVLASWQHAEARNDDAAHPQK